MVRIVITEERYRGTSSEDEATFEGATLREAITHAEQHLTDLFEQTVWLIDDDYDVLPDDEEDTMTESKPTPGAIRAAYDIVDSASKYRIENDRERWVDEIARIIDRETAAPELLKALELWQGGYQSEGADWVQQWEDCIEATNAAIAHARGEA